MACRDSHAIKHAKLGRRESNVSLPTDSRLDGGEGDHGLTFSQRFQWPPPVAGLRLLLEMLLGLFKRLVLIHVGHYRPERYLRNDAVGTLTNFVQVDVEHDAVVLVEV